MLQLDLLEEALSAVKIMADFRHREDKAQLLADQAGDVFAASRHVGPREAAPWCRAARKIVRALHRADLS
jgi:hypothetical protein